MQKQKYLGFMGRRMRASRPTVGLVVSVVLSCY